MLLKNTAGGVYLYAATTAGPATGIASTITGSYSLDGGTAHTGFTTANPTEIGGGLYWQPLLTAECNGNAVAYWWSSSTGGVQVSPVWGFTDGGAVRSNPVQWAGTAVTTPNVAGVPIVDVGYVSGTAATPVAGNLPVDVQTIKTQTVTAASGVTFPASIYGGGAVASVTAAVTLPTAPTNWLTASAVQADAVTKIQAGLSTYAGGPVASVTSPSDSPGVTTLLGVTSTIAGLYRTGTVSAVTSASSFTVNFASAITAADLLQPGGQECCFLSSDLAPAKSVITGATQGDSTHVVLTFTTPFLSTPTISDTVLVI